MPPADLRKVDPVVLNLSVAKGIPALADLDVPRYQKLADTWAADIRKMLPGAEREFQKAPQDWARCIHLFRLGTVAYYVDTVLGIRYREDHAAQQRAGIREVYYTDPGDLFLHKVMDERRGTCGNMAALHWVLGRRLGWPVTLSLVWSHFLVRFDNGQVRWNAEASSPGRGGFNCHTDEQAIQEFNLDRERVRCGSDLATLTPRQALGCFFDLRGRHFNNTNRFDESLADSERAVTCYPESWYLLRNLRGAQWNMGQGFGASANVGAGF